MTTRKKLVEITVATTFDSGLYRTGEIDGLFSCVDLDELLLTYGLDSAHDLIVHLAYLQKQVLEACERFHEMPLQKSAKHSCPDDMTGKPGDHNNKHIPGFIRCGRGHETPAHLWNCPVCTEQDIEKARTSKK